MSLACAARLARDNPAGQDGYPASCSQLSQSSWIVFVDLISDIPGKTATNSPSARDGPVMGTTLSVAVFVPNPTPAWRVVRASNESSGLCGKPFRTLAPNPSDE
jgi:hypothetical protein